MKMRLEEICTGDRAVYLIEPRLDKLTQFSRIILQLSNCTIQQTKSVYSELFGPIFAELFQFKIGNYFPGHPVDKSNLEFPLLF